MGLGLGAVCLDMSLFTRASQYAFLRQFGQLDLMG